MNTAGYTRTTPIVNINEPSRVMLRENLLFEGRLPSDDRGAFCQRRPPIGQPARGSSALLGHVDIPRDVATLEAIL